MTLKGFKSLPRNNALAESLNLINKGSVKEISCPSGLAGESKERTVIATRGGGNVKTENLSLQVI